MAQGREVSVEEFPGLAGLAALEKDWRRLPLSIWALVGSRENDVLVTASSADLLCPDPARHPELLSVVRRHLSRRSPRAALMLLGRVTGDSMASDCARLGMLRGSTSYSHGGFYVLRTDCEFFELEGRLPRPLQRKLRSRARRLAELGELRFEVVKKFDTAFGAAYARFLEVEASGWKGAAGTCSALCFRDRQLSFIEALHKHASEVVPQVHLLWLGENCIAADYFWRYRKQLIRLKISYDEAFRKLGIGHHMLMEAARRACQDPELDYIDRVTASSAARGWGGEGFQALEWNYAGLGGIGGTVGSALLRLPDRAKLHSGFAQLLGRKQQRVARSISPQVLSR